MTEQESQRRKKLKLLQEDPYSIENVECNSSIKEIIEAANARFHEITGSEYSFLGRVISDREAFLTVRYDNEDLQIYLPNETEKVRNYFKKYVDLGDVLYLKGTIFKTKKDVCTIRIFEAKIVSKCLNPFTSLYYGINSDDLKYKNRVGKALVDRDFLKKFYFRFEFIKELRQYLYSKDYVEVETPVLELVYGGANAVPFRTNCRALKQDFFLRIATEISLKKMIISGFPKVFEIGKVFRNEGIDSTHNPEFTSLEIYTVNDSFKDLMNFSKNLIQHMAKVMDREEVNWNGQNISFSSFDEFSISELVKREVGVDFYSNEVTLEQALKLATEYKLDLADYEKTVGCVLHKLFDCLISPKLIKPTFVYGFHKDVSPLSKTDPDNPNFTLRYELFIGGMEFANGFLELSDPDDQLNRFKSQEENRKLGNEEAFGIDDSFIFALKYGLPPTAGLGIGIDRLIMMFTESNSIKDVLFFPIVSNK